MKQVKTNFLGTDLILETGKLAKQANGSVTVSQGNSLILTTVVGSSNINRVPFFPLTCQYVMKYYSQGKIPGGFIKRENRPSEYEVLMSRLMDRPLRPLFEKWYLAETQVMSTVLSYDEFFSPESLAILGASASLLISDLPYSKPIAGIRVGYVDGKFIGNAAAKIMADSELDLFLVASKDDIIMVEASAVEVSETIMLEALSFGFKTVQPLIKLQEDLVAIAGKTKISEVTLEKHVDATIVESQISDDIKNALFTKDKINRNKQVFLVVEKAVLTYGEDDPVKIDEVKEIITNLSKKIIRQEIINNKSRVDGRGLKDIRPIECELGILPKAHGSALFTRGETQTLVSLTLGTKDDSQMVDDGIVNEQKRFYLHYNFPSYSVGEVRRLGPPNRREIGHGKLAERSIQSVLPDFDQNFPYTIRLVSEVLESNGSSSMATVCGASLALMDGGIATSSAVAGIAMGLVMEENGKHAILSDILGDEDHVGDMDFKVAGTDKGVTGLQMDIKIDGLSHDLIKEALLQAKEGRMSILETMKKTILKSRPQLASNAPRYIQYKIDASKIKKVIGTGGQTIKNITSQTNAKIDISSSGMVNIAAYNQKNAEEALVIIQELVKELEIGEVYEGVVKKMTNFGAYLECLPGINGYLHIADISNKHIDSLEKHLKYGQVVKVRAIGFDKRNNVRLSSKEFTS